MTQRDDLDTETNVDTIGENFSQNKRCISTPITANIGLKRKIKQLQKGKTNSSSFKSNNTHAAQLLQMSKDLQDMLTTKF